MEPAVVVEPAAVVGAAEVGAEPAVGVDPAAAPVGDLAGLWLFRTAIKPICRSCGMGLEEAASWALSETFGRMGGQYDGL